MTVHLIYFSPTHSSKKAGQVVARQLARDLGQKEVETSLTLPKERTAPLQMPPDTVLVCAFPVYGGRVPAPFAQYLATMKAAQALAVPIAVYGNRDIDDALLEAADILTGCGCKVIAGISAVAQHTFDASIGAGRPDQKDVDILENFAGQIAQKVKAGGQAVTGIPGNKPYKQAGPGKPITPLTSDKCNFCGICAVNCPTGAIDETDEHIIGSGCILCAACVKYCPQDAKSLPEPFLDRVRQMLSQLASSPKENRLFI